MANSGSHGRFKVCFPLNATRSNIEDTHITNPDKLATLLVIVALAMTWAYRCASRAMGRQGILKKAHKRRVKSWFRIGFDMLRRWILYDTEKPFKLGDKPAQNDHFQTQTAAALWHESCTVIPATVHDATCNEAEISFKLSREPAPNDHLNDHLQARTGAALCYVSCTMDTTTVHDAVVLRGEKDSN